MGNLGQFETRLLRLVNLHAYAGGENGDSSTAGNGSGPSAAASPDPAGMAAAAPLDPLSTNNALGLFLLLFYHFVFVLAAATRILFTFYYWIAH